MDFTGFADGVVTIAGYIGMIALKYLMESKYAGKIASNAGKIEYVTSVVQDGLNVAKIARVNFDAIRDGTATPEQYKEFSMVTARWMDTTHLDDLINAEIPVSQDQMECVEKIAKTVTDIVQ